MDTTVAAAVIAGCAAVFSTGLTVVLQTRGQRLATEVAIKAAADAEKAQEDRATMNAWQAIVQGQDRRIVRLERAEQHCQDQLAALRKELE